MTKEETKAGIYNWSAEMLRGKKGDEIKTKELIKEAIKHGLQALLLSELQENTRLICG